MADEETLADSLLEIVDQIRTIPDELGFRKYRLFVVTKDYDGEAFSGSLATTTTETEITNLGSPPRYRRLNSEDYLAGAAPDAELEFGPITPQYDGYGLDITTFDVDAGDEIYFLVKGREFGDGTKFVKTALHSKTLGWFIQLKRMADGT